VAHVFFIYQKGCYGTRATAGREGAAASCATSYIAVPEPIVLVKPGFRAAQSRVGRGGGKRDRLPIAVRCGASGSPRAEFLFPCPRRTRCALCGSSARPASGAWLSLSLSKRSGVIVPRTRCAQEPRALRNSVLRGPVAPREQPPATSGYKICVSGRGGAGGPVISLFLGCGCSSWHIAGALRPLLAASAAEETGAAVLPPSLWVSGRWVAGGSGGGAQGLLLRLFLPCLASSEVYFAFQQSSGLSRLQGARAGKSRP
jgi:hypothetical protein